VSSADAQLTRGTLYATLAYGAWGVVPIFWKLLERLEALEILAHRVLWSVVFVAAALVATRRMGAFVAVLGDRKTLSLLLASALLIAVNWGIFIWAVLVGRLVDASLGYFVNPLANVALGVVLLRERLRPLQWAAVALGAAGLGIMLLARGAGPLVPLTLACTFAAYGLIRKVAKVESLVGLFVETLVTAPLAIGYLVVREVRGDGLFGRGELGLLALACLAGPITALPLASFAAAARRLPLSTLGFFQYLAPTLQFLTAVVLFGEQLDPGRLAAFAVIWAALTLIALDAARARRATL
jgi:chloramphenicol-sensitive protein RarD